MWSESRHENMNLREKKLAQQNKNCKADTEGSSRTSQKRGLEEAEVTTEEVKRLIKTGAFTLKKAEEKQTFKRSKQLDRKIKDGEFLSPSSKFQPYNDAGEVSSASSHKNEIPHLYDSFVETGVDDGDNYSDASRRGTTIYVRGYDLMEDSLRSSFGEFGRIVRVHVEDRRRSAFVEFDNHVQADRAIKEMNGNMVNGITLRVTMARRQNYSQRREGFYDRGGYAPRGRGSNSWSDIAASRSQRSEHRREGGDRDMVSYDDAAHDF